MARLHPTDPCSWRRPWSTRWPEAGRDKYIQVEPGRAPDARHLPNERSLAPECTLTCARVHRLPQQEADPALIDAGMRIYKTTALCEVCHGWTGRGGMANDEPENDPGPSLVHSELDREAMIEIVSCGTGWPREMPQYLATAWSDEHPCYGKTAADLPSNRRPPRINKLQLLPSQIESVVTYVQEVYQGKEMMLEYCIKYNGPTSRSCNRYR